MDEHQPLPLFPDDPGEPAFQTVAKIGDIPEGQGRAFTIGKNTVAVFLHEGKYFAIDDFCPHQGASLAEGYIEDCAVACPWHHWRFSIADGTWLDNRRIKIEKYAVRIHGQNIQVQVPEPRSNPS
ncbi:MAG: Rieske 2Fe-2S domain-containing protein [Planctomycetales bacterium]|nr:Rieske 2Fe-2S domain-containing protein [Planctomycetales bacterium]